MHLSEIPEGAIFILYLIQVDKSTQKLKTMKMFHKVFLTLSLCLLSSLIVFAQPGTLGAIKVDGEAQEDKVVKLSPGQCQLTLPLKVKLANLALNGEGDFMIPPGYPEMHLEYTVFLGPYPSVPGPTVVIPVVGFEAAGSANGRPVYVATMNSYEVDIAGFCQTSATGGVYAHAKVNLVTPQGDGYIDYPVCDYTSPYDIFSCTVFAHAGDCAGELPSSEEGGLGQTRGGDLKPNNDDERGAKARGPSGPPRDPCNARYLRSTTFLYEMQCPNCELTDPQDDVIIGDNFISNNPNSIDSNLGDLSVYPNPVNDQLNIQWSHKEPLEGLKLYRSNGSLVKIWNAQQLNALNLLELSTSELSQGIYFLEAQSANNTKVIKVVKQ